MSAWEQDSLLLRPKTFAAGLCWVLYRVSSHQCSSGHAKPGASVVQSRGSLASSDAGGTESKNPRLRRATAI